MLYYMSFKFIKFYIGNLFNDAKIGNNFNTISIFMYNFNIKSPFFLKIKMKVIMQN